MLSQISIRDKVCHFEQGSSVMDPSCRTENISVSLQSPETLEIKDDDISQRMAPLDGHVLVNGSDSTSITEVLSQKEDDKGKDAPKADSAYKNEFHNNAVIAPRRSGRNSKLSPNLATVPARSGRTISIKTASVDVSSLQITRKRRSFFSKQARSSVWGLLDNMVQSFEHNLRLEIASSRQKNIRLATNGGKGNDKHCKNHGQKSRKSKGKSCVPTGLISLKVKFGPHCLMDAIPHIDDTKKNCAAGEELKKLPEIASNVDDSFGEKLPSMQFHGCNGNLDNDYVSLLDGCQPGNNTVQDPAAKSSVCHDESPSSEERSIFNGFSDAGTSPDSEVINLNPDTPVNVSEGLHDSPLSKPYAVVFLGMHENSSKKVKENRRLPKFSDCVSKDLLSPESVSTAQVFGNLMQGEKQKVGSCCSDVSVLTTPGKGSGNMFSTEIFSGDLLHCSGVSGMGIFCASSKLESDIEGNRCSSLDTEFPESGLSEKLIFSPDEQKVSKGGRLKLLGKCKSEVPKSSKGRRKKKGNEEKEDIMHEVKHKVDLVKGLGEVRQHSGTEIGTPPALGQAGYEKKMVGGISNLDILQSEVVEHLLPPRNAWVQCDDCLKWRRIPSLLADQIEETNCRWTCKDNLDRDFADCSFAQEMSNSEINAELEISDSSSPSNAWVQCDECLKWRRIPSLLADQIEETNCRWTCKDNQDRAFSDCSFAQEKSNSEINAELEISDGSGEEDVSRTQLSSNGSEQKNQLVAHQSSWTRIRLNLFLHRSRKNQNIDEMMVCHCKPPSNGKMGCGDGCLNRMLNIECARGTCPCGEYCSNQQFQKRNYAKLKCFKCGKKGYGLQLLEDVSEGQFLIEYVGEVLDMHAYEARQKEYALKGQKHFYFMTLNGSEVIDACAKGNLGRFINHSCDPNCRTEKWMVNGEVCIGLFAIRDIKKGEEVTFDYNYVRVFGAAAKKCACGSPHCRGYIGGDPLNAEVIVPDDSDDEYPEPLLLCEDGDVDNKQDTIICATSSIILAETKIQGEPPKNNNPLDEFLAGNQETFPQKHTSSITGQEDVDLVNSSLIVREESENFHDGSPASALKAETSVALKASECVSHSSVQPLETSLSLKDTLKTMSGVRKECSVSSKVRKYSLSSPEELEITSLDAVVGKSLRKSKSRSGRETHGSLKSCPLAKTLRGSSPVKGKHRNNVVNSGSPPDVGSKLQVSQPKFKKPPNGSLHGHFEAVEEKLNELLDHDGGICKRKDASRCYLKLLLLTAASGDGCNGEAIQSNRGLSMILDAILKTKSRTVLADIINKNGLQMLHNIMKRYRREFNKIPILRKLLKVLEYLAVREILSPEHINGDASRAGVESFRESILGLADHEDKQVHQIARNFRDKWIPKYSRKRSCIDRDDSRHMDIHSGSQYNRCLASQNQHCDLGGGKSSEATEYTSCHSRVGSVQADASVLDSSSSCSNIRAASGPRKRKSQWDQEPGPKSDPRNESNVADDQRGVLDDDIPPGYEFPPGFSAPMTASRGLSDASSVAVYSLQERKYGEPPQPVVMGNLQQRFISRLPVSYGIPFSKVQQFGSPQKGSFDAWTVAPGIPFQPFPPLPPYPRDRRDFSPCASKHVATGELPQHTGQDFRPCSTGQNPASISGANQPQAGTGSKFRCEQATDSHNSGRKHFRKQKFSKSRLRPPWTWRSGRGEYNSKGSMCSAGVASRENEFRGTHSWMEHDVGMQSMGHTSRHNNTFKRY